MPTHKELVMLQSLPLELKIEKSKARIREWVNYHGKDHVYVSFSGGKDSTVLANLVRQEFPNTPLLEKYGFPIISKEVSEMIYQVHQYRESNPKLIEKRLFGVGKNKVGKIPNKWMPLLGASFKIGNGCCNVMKKSPIKSYERKHDMKPFIGTMTDESRQRQQAWLKSGCNSFEGKRQISTPISFWTEQDVLQYIKDNNIEIASVYGDIIEEDGKLKLTKCQRTGCMFCMFGVHLEKDKNRFQQMKETHPQIYDYCINKLGIGKVLDFIGVKYD